LDGITPPDNWIPAEPTANAAPRLLNNVPLQLFVTIVSAKVIAPGVIGNVSINVAPVRATELLFDNTICNVDTPVFGRIGLVKKDLEIAGDDSTVILAFVAVPFDAAAGPVIVKSPTLIMLVLSPTVVPVMVAVTVHDPFAGIVPADKVTVDPLAVLVPTHVPPGADAINPVGTLSVKAAPVIATAVGLLKVIVKVDVPFIGTVAILNALLMLGRATFNVALVPTELVPILELTAPAAMVLV
jgi:hypothetical protein